MADVRSGVPTPRPEATCSLVTPALESYLDWGQLRGGFARMGHASCRGEYLLAFSYQTCNSCSRCQVKRAVLPGEKPVRDIIEAATHRHLMLTRNVSH